MNINPAGNNSGKTAVLPNAGKTQKIESVCNSSANSAKATQRIDWFAMNHPVAGDSHPGFCRTSNEDSYGYYIGQDNRSFFLAVADGIGGHGNGDFASTLLIRELLIFWRRYEKTLPANPKTVMQDLCDSVRRINREIYDLNVAAGIRLPMGTTLVCLALLPGKAITLHLGDSRAYLIRDHQIKALTQDHSCVSEMLRTGTLSPEKAAGHPLAHVILRSVGPMKDVEPELHLYDRVAGDRFLLCTDGLTEHLSDQDILRSIDGNSNTTDAARSLIHTTLRNGAKDNVTVICTFQ